MEIIRGSPHNCFDINEKSSIGEARRYAVNLASELGFDEVNVGRVALIVTELGTNLYKHARQGRLLIATRSGSNPKIEILSVDSGPGIPNLENAMRDGYSTTGSSGTGLGATRRLSNEFDIYTDLLSGTIIVTRVNQFNSVEIKNIDFKLGVLGICAPLEKVSGDGWVVIYDRSQAAVLLADGLGHGPEAMAAADAAINQFLYDPFENLSIALNKSHAALRLTRGAAVSMAIVDSQLQNIRYAGAGNIVTRLVSGTTSRSLINPYGTVGVNIKRSETNVYPLPPSALIIMHTDGLLSRWKPEVLNKLIIKDPSIAAAFLLREFCRGRDDTTILVLQTAL